MSWLSWKLFERTTTALGGGGGGRDFEKVPRRVGAMRVLHAIRSIPVGGRDRELLIICFYNFFIISRDKTFTQKTCFQPQKLQNSKKYRFQLRGLVLQTSNLTSNPRTLAPVASKIQTLKKTSINSPLQAPPKSTEKPTTRARVTPQPNSFLLRDPQRHLQRRRQLLVFQNGKGLGIMQERHTGERYARPTVLLFISGDEGVGSPTQHQRPKRALETRKGPRRQVHGR